MLKSIVLYARNVSRAASFYSEGLGMRLTRKVTDDQSVNSQDGTSSDWSEAVLQGFDSVPLIIHRTDHEAYYSTGCSPVLAFRVEELETLLPKLLLKGAFMDGKVHYDTEGKMIRLRTPDGHMIALYELTSPVVPSR